VDAEEIIANYAKLPQTVSPEGIKGIFRRARFLFLLLYEKNKYFCAQQNLGDIKSFEGVLPGILPVTPGL